MRRTFSPVAHNLTIRSNFDREKGRKRHVSGHFRRWHGCCEGGDAAIRGNNQLEDYSMKRTKQDSVNLPTPRFEEPDADRRLYVNCGKIEDLMSIPAERRERITWVRIEFTPDIQTCIAELKRFPNLKTLFFVDCTSSEIVGIDAYRGLSELKNLDTLCVHDSAVIDAATIKEITKMPSLRSLAIIWQSIASAKVLAGLEGCKALEYLELWIDKCEVFADDLAFVANLGNLKRLDLDGCDKIDVSRLLLPSSLEAFTPPNYGYKDAKKIVPEGCVVVKSGTIHPPCRDRYVPQAKKDAMAQARKAQRAVQCAKRRVATAVKSLQEELPLIGYKSEKLESLLAEIEQFLFEKNS